MWMEFATKIVFIHKFEQTFSLVHAVLSGWPTMSFVNHSDSSLPIAQMNLAPLRNVYQSTVDSFRFWLFAFLEPLHRNIRQTQSRDCKTLGPIRRGFRFLLHQCFCRLRLETNLKNSQGIQGSHGPMKSKTNVEMGFKFILFFSEWIESHLLDVQHLGICFNSQTF